MIKRCVLLGLFGAAILTSQLGCVPLAAGVVGAAVGHEAAERHDKDDHDRD